MNAMPPEVLDPVTDRTLAPYASAAVSHAEAAWDSWHQGARPPRPWSGIDEENLRQWIRLVFLRALYNGFLREHPLATKNGATVLSPFVDLVARYTADIENLQTKLIHGG